MNRRQFFLPALLALLVTIVFPGLARAEDQDARIEGLLSHVESLSTAKFVRNGSEYDSKSAAKFLRGKWQSKKGEIKTAEDFIAKAATKSSTTGKPYLIKFKDGKEVPCGDYLTEQLGKKKE